MREKKYDLECQIHRLEDKLLRSKLPHDQMELQNIIRNLRKELQQLKWKDNKRIGIS